MKRDTMLPTPTAIRRSRRRTLFTIAAVLAGAFASSSYAADKGPGDGISVAPCTSTSIEGLFHQLIPAIGLQKLGYTVADPVTLAVPAMHQAIASGDCTYAVDHWI